LRRVAGQAGVVGDYAAVDRLLTAALPLIGAGETATLIEVHTARHAALYSMGRLAEGDAEYATIEVLSRTAAERAAATAVQVRSLTHRNRFADAIELGVRSLRELGTAVPSPDRRAAELDSQEDHLYRWLEHTGPGGADQALPEITDPALLAAAGVLNATLPAAYTSDQALFGWLSLEAVRIWDEHGPHSSLVYPVSLAAVIVMTHRGDDATAYQAAQRVLALAEARGYEPGTAQARYIFAGLLACWFEPLENTIQQLRHARAGLIAAGDLANAAYTYVASVPGSLDCGATLDDVLAEAEAGLAFVRRIGGELTAQILDSYPWLAEVLRGERPVTAAVSVPVHRYADQKQRLLVSHTARALAAAIFGDPDRLADHSAAAMPLLPDFPGFYPATVAWLLRGLSVAGQARAVGGGERAGLLAELDEGIGWLTAHAVHAPDNFLHLARLLEAERAWSAGDFHTAAVAFDAARHAVAGRQRPWHRALIAERAARFHLDHQMEHAGYALLAEARQAYAAWGATAKVAQLDWAYPTLRPEAAAGATDATHAAGQLAGQPGEVPHRRAAVTTGTLDLLAILSASQALSSQTSIDGLHERVAEVLGAMTGATGVHLILYGQDQGEWLLPTPGGGTVPAGESSQERAVPMSVLRYVQRTGEPLVAADATTDDRFARDPYLTGVGCCSLLALPILSRGALRAVLLLENRLIRGAFTAERLDAVTLIAGQLAVSLDNAHLYAQLTASRARIVTAADTARRRIERDLHDGVQQHLVSLTLQARAAQAALPPGAAEAVGQLGHIASELAAVLDEVREIARGVHPAVLAVGGLGPALKALARRSAVPVRLDDRMPRRLPEPAELAAYYAVAEALTNTAKHAQATAVHIRAEGVGDTLQVEVRDDGRGGATVGRGTGLIGLTDRIEALGGTLTLTSPPGVGTTITITLPLDHPSHPVPGPAAHRTSYPPPART
jgi:signal transduction histidine kinase